jgi:hypothetical protein
MRRSPRGVIVVAIYGRDPSDAATRRRCAARCALRHAGKRDDMIQNKHAPLRAALPARDREAQ